MFSELDERTIGAPHETPAESRISVSQAAAMLGVSKERLLALVEAGRLPRPDANDTWNLSGDFPSVRALIV